MPPRALQVARLATAAVILAAVVVQFLHPDDPGAVAGNFLSFFTIQSNLIAVAVLVLAATRATQESPPWLDALGITRRSAKSSMHDAAR